jgi:hypothetical protein
LTQNNSYLTLTQDIVTYRPIAKQRIGKHIPAEAYALNNRTSIPTQRITKQSSTIERMFFLRGPCREVIKGQRRLFELVNVENWIEFWKWQSKVIKKWQIN